jgi:hypothetical protein
VHGAEVRTWDAASSLEEPRRHEDGTHVKISHSR